MRSWSASGCWTATLVPLHAPDGTRSGSQIFVVRAKAIRWLERAREAAGDRDVSIGGGAQAIQQYLRAGLVDEMVVHVVPRLLGRGERLFENLDGGPTGYECVEFVSSPRVAHYRFARKV